MTDSAAPPIEHDADRVRDLRRMKVVATALLVAAAVLFVVARSRGWDAVRAFAEAAMVGALADWFAVTALFRHPLGLPIPHTAIIPRRKDQIGRSLGEFVEGNFLSKDVVGGRLRRASLGRRAGAWLADPVNARRAADAVLDGVHSTVGVLDDAEVQAGVEKVVEGRLRSLSVAPLAGRVLVVGIDGGHHHRLVDSGLEAARRFLRDNRETFRRRLATESPWWVPEPVDERIFAKIEGGLHRFLDDVIADPHHEVRRQVEEQVRAFADRLCHDPALAARGHQLVRDLLEHPDVRAWLGSLWDELKAHLLDATATATTASGDGDGDGDGDGELRRRTARTLERLGGRLADDVELQARVERGVERVVAYLVEGYRTEVTALIESTIASWDAASTSRKLEVQVGRDLQFIRINGTLVGGMAGVLIHVVARLLP